MIRIPDGYIHNIFPDDYTNKSSGRTVGQWTDFTFESYYDYLRVRRARLNCITFRKYRYSNGPSQYVLEYRWSDGIETKTYIM